MRSLSLRFSGLLCAYAKVDLHLLYLRCLKIHLYLGLLSSYHFLFDLSAPVPDSLPHFCFAFRVFPHLFRLSSFLSLSWSILFLLALPHLPRSPSPSVSACSNMATRCPITRLVLATVFPPPFICRRPRRRKNPHQPRHPVLFFAFSFTIRSIHPYSSASIAPCSSVSYRAGYLISDINRGNHAAPSWNNGTEK